MLDPSQVLVKQLEDMLSGRKFDPRSVRTSALGECRRKVIYLSLRPEQRTPIPAIYALSGRMLERRAYEAFKAVYPLTEEQVTVKHPWGESHPDIYVPEMGWYVECKGASAAAVRAKTLKPTHRDQVQSTWGFWREAGGCWTQDGRWLEGVPTKAFILLQSREDWGESVAANQVRWDGERFDRLRDEMEARDEAIMLETLPERPYDKPTWECIDRVSGEIRCSQWVSCWCEGGEG